MNFRSIFVVAIVAALAWGTGVLIRSNYQLLTASPGPTRSAQTPPALDQLAPNGVPVADQSQDAERHVPASSIDCTRGIACPIIYAPRSER
jgi:hypothetical protein